jgi:DNA-binding MarR family transcriptional regulator
MAKPSTVVLTWRNLHLADGAVRAALDGQLSRDANCSLIEHDLMAWLEAAPHCTRGMYELAGLLGVTPGGVTRIVDRLITRGWLTRDRPSRNRREVTVGFTAAGENAFATARTAYLAVLDETLAAHLTERELATLERITSKVLAAVAPEQLTH